IKVLTGQLAPAAGRVRVAGYDLESEFHKIKPLFGYVPDFDNHFEEFTAEENLRFYCGLYGADPKGVDDVLARVELSAEKKNKVRAFSKGMKKKLSLAREMLHHPKILYLDEPTANLDVHSTQNVRRMLMGMRDQGTTVFVTTHNMEEAEEVCDRIAIIDHGKVVEVNSPLMFKAAHTENLVDVVYDEDGKERRVTLKMSLAADRERLAGLIASGQLLTIHSKEFNFKQVFLKLTGREFN
ncbi:MAG: ABC transporter ATP-binding protein, partial [Candidatus Methylomirabilis sp.]|nr:ABC transporter ATP-binding protein [Deltaproteobacteria bacterium]